MATSSVSTFKERNWRRLLVEMGKHNVVPIIGPELLCLTHKGKTGLLYNMLAGELAERLEIEGAGAFELGDVIYRHSSQPGSDPSEPYYELWDILRQTRFEIPEGLRLLAEIDAFDLYVTTTFDDLMARALDEVRFAGQQKTIVLSYKKGSNGEDIPAVTPSAPIVYHAFGKATTLKTYVVTEEDLLEFGHLWQDEDKRPKRLSVLLRDRYVLVLGCSYENWLSRFFMCAVKWDLLFESGKGFKGLIADNRSRDSKELALFLSRCQTHLYSEGSALDFVRELARRWREYKEQGGAISETEAGGAESAGEFVPGSIFISYASEDKEAARNVKNQLEAAGLQVWFDEQKLEAGDKFKAKILQNIEESSLFIPILSRNVLTTRHRFFRLEWTRAVEEMAFRPVSAPFILPIAIDDISVGEPMLPREFAEVQWERTEGGQLPDDFVKVCKQQLRALRREEAAR